MPDFAKLQSLFDQACELPADQQAAFVDQACGDDAELKSELLDLLAADVEVKDHTARKAVGDLSALLNEGRPDALVGAQVGRYTLVSLIGAGGMGSVYLAERHDGVVQQRVAIKFLGRDLLGDGFRQRFEIEREILARLDHPSITRLIDAEQLADGTPYYVMEYVEGQPITAYAFAQQLDIAGRLKLFVEVAKAVAHAHQALIVHRDIKPGNILVDSQGAPHLLDFGIAKPLAQLGAQTVSMTVTGQRFFSPQHAAPEQLLGGNITVGCDVYGLGCLLYELLSGEPAIPLSGLTAAEAETRILHELPQAPSQRVLQGDKNAERAAGFGSASVKAWSKAIKGELDSIVLTCLRKLPHERYRSVDELIADVEAFQSGLPISASGGHGWYRTKKFVARHRWAVTAATLTAIALISSSVITALQSREAKIQRDAAEAALVQAEQQRDRAQHVTQFLIDAFAAANPGGELGKSVTAKEILEHGAKKLETELDGQPELKAQLLATIAKAQLALGLVDESEQNVTLAGQSLPAPADKKIAFDVAATSLSVSLARREIPQVIKRQAQLAPLVTSATDKIRYFELTAAAFVTDSRPHDMISFLEGRLQELEDVELTADERLRVLLLKVRLAVQLLWTPGRKSEGEQMLVGIQSAIETSDASNAELQIETWGQLSIAHRRAGNHDAALRAARLSASLAETYYGPNSTKYADALTTLANAQSELGDFKDALSITERVGVIYRDRFGLASARLATIYNNSAYFAAQSSNLPLSLEYYEDSVSIAESQLRSDSSSLYFFRLGRMNTLSKLGDCDRVKSEATVAIEGIGIELAIRPSRFKDVLDEALGRCGFENFLNEEQER